VPKSLVREEEERNGSLMLLLYIIFVSPSDVAVGSYVLPWAYCVRKARQLLAVLGCRFHLAHCRAWGIALVYISSIAHVQ
jgi:hypothetical protein